jgi:hypothetical protein
MAKAVFKSAAPCADDAMNLPVRSIDAAIPYYEKTFGFRVVSRQDAPVRWLRPMDCATCSANRKRNVSPRLLIRLEKR